MAAPVAPDNAIDRVSKMDTIKHISVFALRTAQKKPKTLNISSQKLILLILNYVLNVKSQYS